MYPIIESLKLTVRINETKLQTVRATNQQLIAETKEKKVFIEKVLGDLRSTAELIKMMETDNKVLLEEKGKLMKNMETENKVLLEENAKLVLWNKQQKKKLKYFTVKMRARGGYQYSSKRCSIQQKNKYYF